MIQSTTRPNSGAADLALIQRLRALLDYDDMTGFFYWRVTVGRNGKSKAGDIAGAVSDHGYVVIGVDGVARPAHRLAWLFVHGEWPRGDIDHIDGRRDNNRIANLRDVSRSVNSQNSKGARKNNRSCGLLGATRKRGRWQAQLMVDGKRVYLGYFPTAEAAHQAYLDAKRRLHAGNTL